jgi:hypothetical protein
MNVVVLTCVNIPGSTSYFSKNLAVLCNYLNCTFQDVPTLCVNNDLNDLLTWTDSLDETCMAEASVIVDLCRSRFNPDFFSRNEIEFVLYVMCTLR